MFIIKIVLKVGFKMKKHVLYVNGMWFDYVLENKKGIIKILYFYLKSLFVLIVFFYIIIN